MLKNIIIAGLILSTSATYVSVMAAVNPPIAATDSAIDVSQQNYPLAAKQLEIVGAPAAVQIDTQKLLQPFGAQVLDQMQLWQLAQSVQQAYAAQGVRVTHVTVPTQNNDGTLTLQVSVAAPAPTPITAAPLPPTVAAAPNATATSAAGWENFSSGRSKATNKPELFLVPSRSTHNIVTNGSPVVKVEGTEARSKLNSNMAEFKKSAENKTSGVKTSVQTYPLAANKLVLLNAPAGTTIDTQALLQPYHGQIKSPADLSTLAAAVRQAYSDQGIALVNVLTPSQNNDGTIVLQLAFGRVISATVQGDTGKSTSWVQYYLDQMKAEYPVRKAQMERWALLIDQLPGIDVDNLAQTQLNATGTAQDINVIAATRYSPLSGYFSLANGAPDYLGPYQVQTGMTWNQPTGPDAFGIDAMKSAPIANELTYYDFKYDRFLTKNDLNLGLFYSHTETQPGGAFAFYNIKGQGDTGRVTLTQPWIMTKDLRFSNSLILMNMHADSVYNALNLEGYNDRITTLGLRTNLSFRDGRSWNQLNILLTLGEPWLGAPNDPANPSTPGAKGRFYKTQADLTRTQYLTDNISVIAGVVGQYTRNSLYASQQLNYGNTLYGRAYTSSGIEGDNGYLGRLQANYNLRGIATPLAGIVPYTFYDVGEMYDNANALAPSERFSASSGGVGINSALAKNWYLDMYAAKPLTHDVDANVERGTRWVFSLVGSF